MLSFLWVGQNRPRTSNSPYNPGPVHPSTESQRGPCVAPKKKSSIIACVLSLPILSVVAVYFDLFCNPLLRVLYRLFERLNHSITEAGTYLVHARPPFPP